MGNQNQTRTMSVELPTGTLKRFVIPVFSATRYSSLWNARLLDEKGKLRANSPNIAVRKQLQWEIPVAGAITRAASGLPNLPEVKVKDISVQPAVARLQVNIFPDNPIALEGLDTLYLNPEKALDLKIGQVNALLAWLHSGGHLIVGVEQVLHVNGNEWLRGLLPCEFNTLTTVQSHGELQDWLIGNRRRGEYSSRDPGGTTQARSKINRPNTSPLPNPYTNLKSDDKFEAAPLQVAIGSLRDGTILFGSDAMPLAITAKRGRGQITVLTFSPELEPFISYANRSMFWAKLVGVPPELLVSDKYDHYGGRSIDGVFGAMVDSKQVRKLPVGWLLLLLVGYLVVIGPLDQYWLKKINRQMLTWLTFPAYVALFSVLIYIIGYKLRAGETEWNELHVVDIMPFGEKADLRGRTFASIYSPVNARYQLASDQPFATLRGEFMGNFGGNGQEGSRANVEQRGNSFAADISVPVWTSQLYVGDWWRQGASPLQVSVTAEGTSWSITVDNRLETKLSNVSLAIENYLLPLGDVPAKQSKTFKVARNSGNPLSNFVQTYGGQFEQVFAQRQHVFGNAESGQLQNIPQAAIAASFVSQLPGHNNYNGNGGFITPPGFDLSPLVERGDAVLLAWASDYTLVKPMNRFTARHGHRDSLLRVAVSPK